MDYSEQERKIAELLEADYAAVQATPIYSPTGRSNYGRSLEFQKLPEHHVVLNAQIQAQNAAASGELPEVVVYVSGKPEPARGAGYAIQNPDPSELPTLEELRAGFAPLPKPAAPQTDVATLLELVDLGREIFDKVVEIIDDADNAADALAQQFRAQGVIRIGRVLYGTTLATFEAVLDQATAWGITLKDNAKVAADGSAWEVTVAL